MNIHHHAKVNALVNPVTYGDIVLSESGEPYKVMQNICGHYWLRHAATDTDITRPCNGQVEIVRQIDGLKDL